MCRVCCLWFIVRWWLWLFVVCGLLVFVTGPLLLFVVRCPLCVVCFVVVVRCLLFVDCRVSFDVCWLMLAVVAVVKCLSLLLVFSCCWLIGGVI